MVSKRVDPNPQEEVGGRFGEVGEVGGEGEGVGSVKTDLRKSIGGKKKD